MTSSSSTFSAGAAALQPGGASASGASGGLPSAGVAERAESFVATLESGDYDSDRGENESMLLYTKRCLEQHKKICADGLDADVPKEKFITRLLDGSGLDSDEQKKIMQNVTQKDSYEEVAIALRTMFSQQECSVVEMEHQRQRCVRSARSPQRMESPVEKLRERQLARHGVKVSREKDLEDAASRKEGDARTLVRDGHHAGDECEDTPVEHGLHWVRRRHGDGDLVSECQKCGHCSTKRGTSEAFVHGVPSLGMPVVRVHGAGKRPGDNVHGAGVRVMH